MQNDRKAVFLDRDGTLNVEKGYLHKWEEWQWLPGVREGLARLQNAGYLLIVASNQSGIARGLYTEKDWLDLARKINENLAEVGVRMDGFYFCPHHPDFSGVCDCRKPAPGILLQAAADFGVNLGASWLIGDKLGDIQAALACGARPVLVETGYGLKAKERLPAGIPVCRNFAAAATYVLAMDGNNEKSS